MYKVTTAEKGISQLGDAEFQALCDAFLSAINKYGARTSLGLQSGAMKTTKGTPDTYFVRDNGRYVFAEYTTQQKGLYKKIADDIEKCFDPKYCDIDHDKIDEIVYCHTSSNLSVADDDKLHQLCSDKGVCLTIYSINEIAWQICQRYPALAKEFLNISIDTNQLLTAEEFVTAYNAVETVASLDTEFQGRVNELNALKSTIRESSVVIVHGPAGVGKTRLVLEAVRIIAEEDEYRLLCVKNNNLSIVEDLATYAAQPGKYLFFVDDANDLSELDHILRFTGRKHEGYQVKIVTTVRDFAKQSVIDAATKYADPIPVAVDRLSDQDIRDFLDVNMDIRNDLYVKPIIEVAEGNPRIAYMMGRVAKETDTLAAVHDATKVYELYYGRIIRRTLGNYKNLYVTAVILALVGVAILDELDNLDEILQLGGISQREFKDCIGQLSDMELVDVERDIAASISDQCLANYMLYYVFISERRITLSEVLYVGFLRCREGVVQSVNILLNLFAREELQSYIATEACKTWDRFKREGLADYIDFARAFHVFRPEEAFSIANRMIDALPQQEIISRPIDVTKGSAHSADDILGFLTGYSCHDDIRTAIELLLLYAQKSETNAEIAYSWLETNAGIKTDSALRGYEVENIAVETLTDYVGDNALVQRLILAYVRYLLSFEFHPAEMGRRDVVHFYTIPLTNSYELKKLRANCWAILAQMTGYVYLQKELLSAVQEYAESVHRTDDITIARDDMDYCMNVAESLDCSDLRKAMIVRDLFCAWDDLEIEHGCTSSLFQTEQWQLYEMLENRRIASGSDFSEYTKQREDILSRYADSLSQNNISAFVQLVSGIIRDIDVSKRYDVILGAEIIINRLCSRQEWDVTWLVFSALMECGGNIGICPDHVLDAVLTENNYREVWSIIDSHDLDFKNDWQFAYFQKLPDNCVDSDTYKWLIQFLRSDSDRKIKSLRDMHFLNRFYAIDSEVYITVSRIIYAKREYSSCAVGIYFTSLFLDYLPEEVVAHYQSDTTLLRDIFLYTVGISSLADHDGSFLARFITIDDSWIDAYALMICENIRNHRESNQAQYRTLWMSDQYMQYYDRIFETMSEVYKGDIRFRLRFADAYKEILRRDKDDPITAEHQYNWILHAVDQWAMDEKIKCLFVAISQTDESLRRSAVQEFLQRNTNVATFAELQLDSRSKFGSTDKYCSDMQLRIEYLESLKEFMKGVRFIEHRKNIQDRINDYDKKIEADKDMAVRERRFR